MKHIRKSESASKLARLMGKGGAKDASSGDDASTAKPKAKRTAMLSVDGKAAKGRLDRPGRRMKRADGGPANTISEDSKQKAAALRKEASEDRKGALHGAAKDATGFLVGDMLRDAAKGRLGRGAGMAIQGLSTLSGLTRVGDTIGANRKDDEAASIERGDPIPGKEDRKRGGSVKKR